MKSVIPGTLQSIPQGKNDDNSSKTIRWCRVKHQYFGDIHDYRKYGLLRLLARIGGLRIGLAWMLTPDDYRADGGKIDYLTSPDRWRRADPDLFDFLSGTVAKGSPRNLSTFENASLIPQAVYHSDLLGDKHAERTTYMDSMISRFSELDMVFFDPDNGLEVRSRPMGRKGSSKYLAISEATKVFGAGKSLLIFQHFGRVKREAYIPAQMERLGLATGAAKIVALATPNVLFLFVLHWEHAVAVDHSLRILSERWPGQFTKTSMTAASLSASVQA